MHSTLQNTNYRVNVIQQILNTKYEPEKKNIAPLAYFTKV